MYEDNQQCTFGVDSPYVDLAVEVFELLADATRVRIILALRGGEVSVGQLAERVGRSPTAVSQHLAKLRMGRVVTVRQEGTRMFYRLADERARQLVTDAVFQAEQSLGAESAHEQAQVSNQQVHAARRSVAGTEYSA